MATISPTLHPPPLAIWWQESDASELPLAESKNWGGKRFRDKCRVFWQDKRLNEKQLKNIVPLRSLGNDLIGRAPNTPLSNIRTVRSSLRPELRTFHNRRVDLGNCNTKQKIRGVDLGNCNIEQNIRGVDLGNCNIEQNIKGVDLGNRNTELNIRGVDLGNCNTNQNIRGVDLGNRNTKLNIRGVDLATVIPSRTLEELIWATYILS